MALTNHENIRKFASLQNHFVKEAFNANDTINGSRTIFHVQSDDNVKFVPEFSTGNTLGGVSDVKVWLGLSGIAGVSRLVVSSIDIDAGSVTLGVAPVTGSSLTISYSSSPITDVDIERFRLQSESIINKQLSLCYSLPISPTPSMLESLATRLAAALLLIQGYGVAAMDTSMDGYKLYDQLMGQNQTVTTGTDSEVVGVGEIGLICSPNYQLVDDTGAIIPRNDDGVNSGSAYVQGGRLNVGRLYDISEESFRKKPFQEDVNREQPGSGNGGYYN